MMSPEPPLKIPVEVRYADIDSLQHVNNARYFTFMEQARSRYFQKLDLWDGQTMEGLGVILAQTSCNFLRPIRFTDRVWVEARALQLGNKSFKMRYDIVDDEGKAFAQGEATLVCYSYENEETIPLPDDWRQRIENFEGRDRVAGQG